MCEPASHASHGVNHASHVSHASHDKKNVIKRKLLLPFFASPFL